MTDEVIQRQIREEFNMEQDNGNGYVFSTEDRSRAVKAMNAGRVATQRLKKRHADSYKELVNEERAKLGLAPLKPKMTMREMKRLADLAIENGLG
jgi:uncharacterized protein YkwD